jgi:hypothetical protein
MGGGGHPCKLRTLCSVEDVEAKSYIIFFVVINALIWCNFGKKMVQPFLRLLRSKEAAASKSGNLGLSLFFTSVLVNI